MEPLILAASGSWGMGSREGKENNTNMPAEFPPLRLLLRPDEGRTGDFRGTSVGGSSLLDGRTQTFDPESFEFLMALIWS